MSERPWRYLYNTRRWHRLRTAQLRDEPLCRYCKALGKVTPAIIADHIKPHKGDEELFFDSDNLQSLCKLCHDSAKQSQERTGKLPGCGEDGWPLDPNHHWARKGGG